MKMFSLLCCILSVVGGHAHAMYRFEFGRSVTNAPLLSRKRIFLEETIMEKATMVGEGLKQQAQSTTGSQMLRQLEEIIDGGVMELSMSLSYSYHLSMSLSYSYHPTPVTPRPGTTPHLLPTITPLGTTPSSPSIIPSDYPSLAPSSSLSGSPTSSPAQFIAVTGSPTPLSRPATTTSPVPVTNNIQHQDQQAFECSTETGIGLAEKTEESTPLFLVVGYIVESTSTSTNDFVEALEEQFLMTAVEAAIGCTNNFGGAPAQNLPTRSLASLFGPQSSSKLLAHTTKVGVCPPQIPQATSCFVLETELLFLANGVFNLDSAVYAGYLAIEKQMVDSSYVKQGNIPTVLGLEFQSPNNLIPPNPNDVDDNPATRGANADATSIIGSNINTRGSDNTIGSVSYWTIGGCVATVVGGLVSILVWSKNRRDLRQGHHMQLLDDVSLPDDEHSVL